MKFKTSITAFVALAAAAWIPDAAPAQDYPSRAIKIVAGFPPGGGVDTVARLIGQGMSSELGQPVVVENKPGAAGTIGAAQVAKSDPDGYTLLVTPGGHSLFGAVFQSVPFDTVGSFSWISNVITVPFFIVVPANSRFQSLAALIAEAKSAPGKISFGSAGPGSTHHLGGELLANRTGGKFLHVPYRGDAPVITALLAERDRFRLRNADAGRQQRAGGKIPRARHNRRHPLAETSRRPDRAGGARPRRLQPADLVRARRAGAPAASNRRSAERGSAQGVDGPRGEQGARGDRRLAAHDTRGDARSGRARARDLDQNC